MHELSIAQNIIDIIRQNVEPLNIINVQKVYIKVGPLSNVLSESLLFCFNSIVVNTDLENAKLEIENTVIKLKCLQCNAVSSTSEFDFSCPSCFSTSVEVTSGNELFIYQIELDER